MGPMFHHKGPRVITETGVRSNFSEVSSNLRELLSSPCSRLKTETQIGEFTGQACIQQLALFPSEVRRLCPCLLGLCLLTEGGAEAEPGVWLSGTKHWGVHSVRWLCSSEVHFARQEVRKGGRPRSRAPTPYLWGFSCNHFSRSVYTAETLVYG